MRDWRGWENSNRFLRCFWSLVTLPREIGKQNATERSPDRGNESLAQAVHAFLSHSQCLLNCPNLSTNALNVLLRLREAPQPCGEFGVLNLDVTLGVP